MRQRIRKFDPTSVAKMMGVLYGLIGLLFIPIILFIRTMAPDEAKTAMGFGFGPVLAIAFPLIYACIGFVFGFIGAALYNVVAGWVGGIEVELE